MKRIASFVAILALIVSVSGFSGCATNGPQNASQTAFTAKTVYANALDTGVAYDNLPPCDANQPTLKVCSDTAVVHRIKQAKDVAKPAVDAAEAAVRNPDFSKSTIDALNISAYQAALALAAIVDPLTAITHTPKATP